MSAPAAAMLLSYGSVSVIGTPSTIGSSATLTGASNTTISFTTNAAIVSGNLVVISVGYNCTNTISVSSMSDGTNTYTKANNAANAGTGAEIWYKENASAVSSGTAVTATLSGDSSTSEVFIGGCQVTGILTASSLDKTVIGTTSSSSSVSVTTATLSQAKEIAFGTAVSNNTSYSGASGFTNVNSGTSTGWMSIFDRDIVNATTAVTFNAGFAGSSARNAAVAATFKGA